MVCSSSSAGRQNTGTERRFRVGEVGPLHPADSSSSPLTFRGQNKHLSVPAAQTGQNVGVLHLCLRRGVGLLHRTRCLYTRRGADVVFLLQLGWTLPRRG